MKELRWTDEQLEAITSRDDTLLSASAGTGKTRTVIGKILWTLGLPIPETQNGTPVPPCPDPLRLDQIAAITFTRKAANELKEDLRKEIEQLDQPEPFRWDLEQATIGTIHRFATELMREHALRLGIDPTFRILDENMASIHQRDTVREVLVSALGQKDPGTVKLVEQYGMESQQYYPGAIERIIRMMRDLRWHKSEFGQWSTPVESGPWTRTLDREGLLKEARHFPTIESVWADDPESAVKDEESLEIVDTLYRLGRVSVHQWLSWLERENFRDQDSLILDTRRLLTRPEMAEAQKVIRQRYRLLIIDEFQDTDWAQWDIACALAPVDLVIAQSLSKPPESQKNRDGMPEPREDTNRIGAQLFLVGDPKQSIYRFRGAEIDVWNEAQKRFKGHGRVLPLSQNFRSQPALVGFVNRVCSQAFAETAAPLVESAPDSVVPYEKLDPARPPSSETMLLDWLPIKENLKVEKAQQEEAQRVAARIQQMIGHTMVIDPDNQSLRPCRAGDIAILGRTRADLSSLEPTLRDYGIDFVNTATSGFNKQQEILDLVTALHLIDNRFDDLRAFAFLRSPFVGLRDEILTRIGLYQSRDNSSANRSPTLLQKAEAFLEECDRNGESWFNAPEADEVADIEQTALRRGLAALREAHSLVDRVDHVQVLEALLATSDYRLHLLVREGADEALANIDRFLALLEEYRHLTLGRFLNIWERLGDRDTKIPKAQLFIDGNDVVTISTIHSAKGLEWPVVILTGTDRDTKMREEPWIDSTLGPIHLPKKSDWGPRVQEARKRRNEQEQAEASRLFYVALTRARERLVIVASPGNKKSSSFNNWLLDEREQAIEEHETSGAHTSTELDTTQHKSTLSSEADDKRTGTGKQLDAFESETKKRGQFDLFSARNRASTSTRPHDGLVIIRREGGSHQMAFREAPVNLQWLSHIEKQEWPLQAGQIEIIKHHRVGSATERMMKDRDLREWELRYLHGVLQEVDYLPIAEEREHLTGKAHGTIVHGVLERILTVEEIGQVIEETILSLDFPDLESVVAAGSTYRHALEEEISRVVSSPEWHWYVEGEHSRELLFIHLSKDGWIQGAFDLYRPRSQASTASGQVSLFEDSPFRSNEETSWVIDFKTHHIEAPDVNAIADDYAIQAQVYREAATALGGDDQAPRVALHFTHPNVVVEI